MIFRTIRELKRRVAVLEGRIDVEEARSNAEREVYGDPFRHFLRLDRDDPEGGLVVSPEMAKALSHFVRKEVDRLKKEGQE